MLMSTQVVTLFIGLIKLQYDKHQERKYTKVEKGKQAQTPEMLEAQPISAEPKADDIPFGIRAIESGIEVDGVWISRTNTPVGSSRSSITEIKFGRSYQGSHNGSFNNSYNTSYNNSQLELPVPKPIHASSSRNSVTSSFDRAVSAERVPTNESRSSSPPGSRPAVASSSRNNSNSNMLRNSTTLQALEGENGYSGGYRKHVHPGDKLTSAPAGPSIENSRSNSGKSSGKSSLRTSDESDYMKITDNGQYEAVYVNPKSASLAAPIDPRTDLDLLQTHRMSHVAETGQLTPRVRRPGNSGEWASVAEIRRSSHEIATQNGVDFFVPRQQKTPSPPLPPIRDEPTPPSSSHFKDAPAFDVQARQQGTPLLETYVPEPYVYEPPQTYQPRGPQFDYDEDPPQQENQAALNAHQSQVIRKVNSGFEILRPGTFGEPAAPEELEPVVTEKRKSKRLQKRRASSSSASRQSHFVEQV